MKLSEAPKTIEKHHEIAIRYNDQLPDLWNKLKPEERVFVYYIWRASLPGNHIAADQIHRHAHDIADIFQIIYKNKDQLLKDSKMGTLATINMTEFINETKTFLVYLWTNHGQYFQWEHANSKRTPERIGLKTLTPENIIAVLEYLDIPNAQKKIEALSKTLFDQTFEPTTTVANNIEQSAVNIYSPDFMTHDYEQLTPEEQSKINSFFYVDTKDNKRVPKTLSYSTQEKYSKELSVSAHWLKKAYQHAQKHPNFFDKHITQSLEYLIQFLETGDEEFFKKHSIEWLKNSSTIDYNFGFIETYFDPKSHRGAFQAEATIKSIDISKLNNFLPAIESNLPLPKEFKRERLDSETSFASNTSVPNASINNKVFGTGGLGPMFITAAYCLPNYEDIRSKYGSKQIIYPAAKKLMMLVNPDLGRKLFYLKKDALWLEQHDPDHELANVIWNVHCILHETIGHGSGKLATHTFVPGDKLTIANKTHDIGDTIDVKPTTVSEFLLGYENAIEELRAEIIALYVSIFHIDKLLECDLFGQWAQKLTPEQLVEQFILGMANTGLRRILQQTDGATEITGAHAHANCTIMYYLIDHVTIDLVEEQVTAPDKTGKDKQHTVLGLRVKDLEKTKQVVTDLMILAQHIKSTGDGLKARDLIETYGRPLRNPEHMKILKENQKTIVGELKTTAVLSPLFTPVCDNDNHVIDISANWPEDIFDMYDEQGKIEFSLT